MWAILCWCLLDTLPLVQMKVAVWLLYLEFGNSMVVAVCWKSSVHPWENHEATSNNESYILQAFHSVFDWIENFGLYSPPHIRRICKGDQNHESLMNIWECYWIKHVEKLALFLGTGTQHLDHLASYGSSEEWLSSQLLALTCCSARVSNQVPMTLRRLVHPMENGMVFL